MEKMDQPSGVEAKPLADWKNTPTVAELKQDLQDAKPIHDAHISQVNEWLDNLNVTGKAKIKSANGGSSIVPKLIRKQAEWRYASLSEPFLSTDDVFSVRPVTWEDKKAAEQNELLLNHQLNVVIDKTRFIDEYVRAAVDEGTVIVRVGWDFQEEEVEEMVPIVEFRVNPELGPLHQQLMELQETSPSEYETNVPDELKQAHELSLEQGQPIEPVIVGEELQKKMRTVKNAPTLDICPIQNVVMDPTCMGNIDKASFLVYSFESSMSELKKDGKYKNLDQIVITPASILNSPDHESSVGNGFFNFNDEPRKKFVVHEYWGYRDIDGSGIVKPIVAAWVGATMIRLEESPFPDKKIPFIVEHYLPVRRSNYGEPDGALLEDNQKVVGAVTRGMIDIMGKSANGQTGIRKDMLDATNRRKFDKGMDYEFNAPVDPRQGVFMHTYPEIPQSAQFMLQLQNMEAESMTGVKSFWQGVSGQSLGDVATAVRGALDAASKRELGILRRLSNGIVKVGRKMISLNAEFLSDKEVVRVTNDEFVTIRKDDLPGNFDLRLSISTPESDNNKAEELAFMLQTIGPNGDPAVGKMILSDICRLRKMPELAEKIENYEPQPDPFMQQKQELELALLDAQVKETLAKAASYQSKAVLDETKAGTEVAKTDYIQSDTDLNNLEFLEQESGVNQERQLQIQREQANSQASLKLVDNAFKMESKNKDLLKEYLRKK
jgi:hypothetical protein